MVKWDDEKVDVLEKCISGLLTARETLAVIDCKAVGSVQVFKREFKKLGKEKFLEKHSKHGNAGHKPLNTIPVEERERIVEFYKNADCKDNLNKISELYNKKYTTNHVGHTIKKYLEKAGIKIPKFKQPEGGKRQFGIVSKEGIEQWINQIDEALKAFTENSADLKKAVEKLREVIEEGENKKIIEGHIDSVKEAAKKVKSDTI